MCPIDILKTFVGSDFEITCHVVYRAASICSIKLTLVREESLLFIKIAGQIDGLHLSSRKLIMVYRSTFKLPQFKQIENKRNNLEFNHYILLWNILLPY